MQARKPRGMLLSLITDTYYPSDVDPLSLDTNDKDYQYASQPLSILTSFFGLPNRRRDNKSNIQTKGNIASNLLGWDSHASPSMKVANVVFAIPTLLFYLLIASFVTVLNIVKLVTEFTPNFIAALFSKVSQFILNINQIIAKQMIALKPEKPFDRVKGVALQVLGVVMLAFSWMNMGSLLFKSIYYVGRAITSPIDSMRFAWEQGNQLIGNDKVIGNIFSLLMVSISLSVSVSAYLIGFPLLVNMGMPWVMTTLSSEWIAALPAMLSTMVGVASQYIFTPIGTVFSPLFPYFGVEVSTPLAGLAMSVFMGHALAYPVRQAYWEGKENAAIAKEKLKEQSVNNRPKAEEAPKDAVPNEENLTGSKTPIQAETPYVAPLPAANRATTSNIWDGMKKQTDQATKKQLLDDVTAIAASASKQANSGANPPPGQNLTTQPTSEPLLLPLPPGGGVPADSSRQPVARALFPKSQSVGRQKKVNPYPAFYPTAADMPFGKPWPQPPVVDTDSTPPGGTSGTATTKVVPATL